MIMNLGCSFQLEHTGPLLAHRLAYGSELSSPLEGEVST